MQSIEKFDEIETSSVRCGHRTFKILIKLLSVQKLRGLPLEGGGFGGLRRRRKEFKFDKTLLPQSASPTAPPEEEPTLNCIPLKGTS